MSQSPTSANTVRILYEPQEYMKYSINYVFELNLQDNAHYVSTSSEFMLLGDKKKPSTALVCILLYAEFKFGCRHARKAQHSLSIVHTNIPSAGGRVLLHLEVV